MDARPSFPSDTLFLYATRVLTVASPPVVCLDYDCQAAGCHQEPGGRSQDSQTSKGMLFALLLTLVVDRFRCSFWTTYAGCRFFPQKGGRGEGEFAIPSSASLPVCCACGSPLSYHFCLSINGCARTSMPTSNAPPGRLRPRHLPSRT